MVLWIKNRLLLVINRIHVFFYEIPTKDIVRIYIKSRRIKKFEGNILSVASTYIHNPKVKNLRDIRRVHIKLSGERIRQILMKIQREVVSDIKHGKYKKKL